MDFLFSEQRKAYQKLVAMASQLILTNRMKLFPEKSVKKATSFHGVFSNMKQIYFPVQSRRVQKLSSIPDLDRVKIKARTV